MNSESFSVRTEEVPPCKNRHCVTRNITERKFIEKADNPQKITITPQHCVEETQNTDSHNTIVCVCVRGGGAFYLDLHCVPIYRELSDQIVGSS